MLHNVHSNLIYNSQKLERTQMSFSKRNVYRKYGTYTQEYYSAIKKNEFMKFLAKWMDLKGIILSEVTQGRNKERN